MSGITDLLGKVLNNPVVQGVGTAAAFGANPLVGLLGAGMIKNSRDRRELENEGLREELLTSKRRRGAQDLLGRQTPTDRILDPLGGPATAIPSATPGGSVPFTETSAGGRALPGLLADLAPQATGSAMAQGLFGRGQDEPPIIRSMRAVGIDPMSPEGKELVQENYGRGGDMDTLMAELQILRLKQDLGANTTETERDNREHEIELREYDNNLNKSAGALLEMAKINEELGEGGFLTRPGLAAKGRSNVASGLALGGELVGADDFAEEQQGGADLTQRFDDLSNSLALDRLAVESFDAGTNQRFSAFVDTKPTIGKGQRPTDQRIADNLEALLLSDSAVGEDRGFSAERRAELERTIQQLRERTLTPQRIMNMGGEQLLEIDADDVDTMTDAQKRALDLRLTQLGIN